MFDISKLKKIDITTLLIILIICLVGALAVFSTTFFPEKRPSSLFLSQVIYYIIGIFIIIGLSTFNYKLLKKNLSQFLVFFAAITLLILVLLVGEEIYGARRWINMGGFTLQPSEFTKLSTILVTSYLLTQFKNPKIKSSKKGVDSNLKNFFYYFKNSTRFSHLFKFLLLSLIILLTVSLVFIQNSLGNALITFAISILIIVSAINYNRNIIIYCSYAISSLLIGILEVSFGLSNYIVVYAIPILLAVSFWFFKRRLNISILIAVVVIGFSFLTPLFLEFSYNNILQPYQRARIEIFVNPEKDTNFGSNWNREQSKIAVGSSGFLGKGFLKGTQTNYKYLPFSFTDFIYASIVEQIGTIGSMLVIGSYGILLSRLVKIAYAVEDEFAKLFVLGIMFMFLLNIVQHIGMNIGILPITGVPLPLISFGGSSIFAFCIGLGIVLSIEADDDNKKSKVVKVGKRRITSY